MCLYASILCIGERGTWGPFDHGERVRKSRKEAAKAQQLSKSFILYELMGMIQDEALGAKRMEPLIYLNDQE